ncbi:rolling circle replication-associated protein [Thiorhodococcus minor]|uniref:Replication-associated protein ORF2/G2P domain-containing protein n=1 Tax=Thiorhodococcus minor TaxID=57489 RepID=A0A6M0K4H8_9GAMM|nr:hypothetical protein [Thiorhodococcus minor]NEV64678.1 hypothetical protein [Thiorhodococcus minor]
MDEALSEFRGSDAACWDEWAAMMAEAEPARPGEATAEPARAGEAGPGLVSSKTSDTHRENSGSPAASADRKTCTLERNPARLKRMQRTVRESSRLLQEEIQHGGFRYWAVFLTLTYAPDQDWEPGHVSAFMKTLREHLRRRKIRARYVWVMELMKNGKPHYHVVVWLPRGHKLPKPDDAGWWPWGSTNIQAARSPVGYLSKYASKGAPELDDPYKPQIPPGARLSGNGGLSKAARQVRSWRLCPAWVRELFTVEDRPVRAPGGGWLSRATGHWEPPRWRIKECAVDWSWITFEEIGA